MNAFTSRALASVDILIPAYGRPQALALNLVSLMAQTFPGFNVVISDQTEEYGLESRPEVTASIRILRARGHFVDVYRHLPRRGMAEQRQFLLEHSTAPRVVFLDDDLILEPDVIGRMNAALEEEKCGFVGCAVIGLSFINDVRPHEQAIEFWEGPVMPELILPEMEAWQRHKLHNAANIYHLQKKLGLTGSRQKKYRVAWVGGCVMYDAEKLKNAGGFSFWSEIPHSHCGEDVLAQINVMSLYGGCGIIPSGAYHQELPTTLPDRSVKAYDLLLPAAGIPGGPKSATGGFP